MNIVDWTKLQSHPIRTPDFGEGLILNCNSEDINDISGLSEAYPKLGTIMFQNMDLSNTDLTELNKLERLNYLFLQKCNLSDNNISVLNLNNVHDLNLSDNNITSIDSLSCPNLRTLILSHNQIERIPDNSNIPNLERLELKRNRLNSLEGIQNFKKLRRLIITNNNISDLNPIKDLKDLWEFRAAYNDISNIDVLKDTRIRHLNISNNKIHNLVLPDTILQIYYVRNPMTKLYLDKNGNATLTGTEILKKQREISQRVMKQLNEVMDFKTFKNLKEREKL